MVKAVRGTIKQGVDWIKLLCSHEPVVDGNDGPICAEMSEELISVAVTEAHARQKKVAVHVMGELELQRVINAGVDAVHHGAFLTLKQARQMKEKGIAFVSTISAYRNTSSPAFERGEQWARENLILRPGFESALKNAMQADVLIAPGTDSLGDLVDELIFMHRFGMGRMECLRSATLNGAQILGQEQYLGSLTEGKLADLVVLEADPSENLENLRRVMWVMKDGLIYHLPNLSLEHMNPRWLLESAPMV